MTNVCGCHSGGLYIYSAVCMMLRIAILIAGWLSCHRPLWCMTASVHSPRVQTSEAHNISLCRWMADSQVASHGRSSSSTFISCIFHFLHVTYVSLDQIFSLFIVITYIHILCEVCLRCVTSGQVLLLELLRKAYFKIFLWLNIVFVSSVVIIW